MPFMSGLRESSGSLTTYDVLPADMLYNVLITALWLTDDVMLSSAMCPDETYYGLQVAVFWLEDKSLNGKPSKDKPLKDKPLKQTLQDKPTLKDNPLKDNSLNGKPFYGQVIEIQEFENQDLEWQVM